MSGATWVGIAVAVGFAALWWKAMRIGAKARRARRQAQIWMHSNERTEEGRNAR